MALCDRIPCTLEWRNPEGGWETLAFLDVDKTPQVFACEHEAYAAAMLLMQVVDVGIASGQLPRDLELRNDNMRYNKQFLDLEITHLKDASQVIQNIMKGRL